jgi:hypothetical protein
LKAISKTLYRDHEATQESHQRAVVVEGEREIEQEKVHHRMIITRGIRKMSVDEVDMYIMKNPQRQRKRE